MAVIRPFKALRPDKKNAHLVASVPYDVVNREEAINLVKDNHLSFLRVTRAEIDLPNEEDPYTKSVYEKAKENIETLKTEAHLLVDDKPHFYIYRLIMDGKAQTGLAATAILTIIAFLLRFDTIIPKVAYLTRMDMVVIISMILVFFAFVEVIFSSFLAQRERKILARKLDMYSRFIFPFLFMVLLLIYFVY